MASVITQVNDTITFKNFTNPYQGNSLWTGLFDSQHVTNASIVYQPETLLTPWPYLLGDLILSLVTALWTYVTNHKKLKQLGRYYIRRNRDGESATMKMFSGMMSENGRPKLPVQKVYKEDLSGLEKELKKYSALDLVPVVVVTIRAVTVFVSTMKAVLGKGGRFRASSALTTLYFPMVMLAVTIDNSVVFAIVLIDGLLVTALMPITIWPRLAHTSAGFYGEWFLKGGTCPVAVHSCPRLLSQVGCDFNISQHRSAIAESGIKLLDINKIGGANTVASAEPIMGAIFSAGGILTLYFLYCLGIAVVQIVRGRISLSAQRSYSALGSDSESLETATKARQQWLDEVYDDTEDKKGTQVALTIILIVIGLVAIPMHYVQQARPKSMWVIDGSGPLVDVNNADAGSWSDCFEVTPVHDRLGFFEYWWNDVKDKPVEWLSVT